MRSTCAQENHTITKIHHTVEHNTDGVDWNDQNYDRAPYITAQSQELVWFYQSDKNCQYLASKMFEIDENVNYATNVNEWKEISAPDAAWVTE